ncbi:MAG: PA0069 family radical SAM protein [Gammaproteobacteria bacterium]|nr:PA0069 family radical SAM protein [Gammaproteobacteria bacterium]
MNTPPPIKGRAAPGNAEGRFSAWQRDAFDDGWGTVDEAAAPLRTAVSIDTARSVITYNTSPDIPFDRSINPYRGCEHGCIYCFARPTHSYLGLSPGLDFESRLFYKPDAPQRLVEELRASGYRAQPIALGINTDAYQPVERKLGLTRRLLEVLAEYRHPVSLVTKSALIERDLDILEPMARAGLVSVAISITTLDRNLARRMEPRAAAPQRRLEILGALKAAGVPAGVLVAPIIPVLTDPELESVLEAARNAGADYAGYVMLRLPHELRELFTDWLHEQFPLKATHVLTRVREVRGGQLNDANFGSRMTGQGEYARLVARRFEIAHKRLHYHSWPELHSERFFVPARTGDQLDLFANPTSQPDFDNGQNALR